MIAYPILIGTILGYLGTVNLPLFRQFLAALISFLKEGKISITVIKFLVQTMESRNFDVSKELTNALELADTIDRNEEIEMKRKNY